MSKKFVIEWDYYLQAFRLHQRMTKASNSQAQVMLTKAIEIGRNGNNDIARAYGLRSFVFLTAWLNDWIDNAAGAAMLTAAQADVAYLESSGLASNQYLKDVVGTIKSLNNQTPLAEIVNSVIALHASAAAAFDPDDYDNLWSLGTACLYWRKFGDAATNYALATSLAKGSNAPDIGKDSLMVDCADKLFYCAPIPDTNNEVKAAIELVLNAISDAAKNAPNDPKRFRWNWTLGWAHYEADEFDKSLAALEAIRNPHDLIIKNLIASYVGRNGNGDLALAKKLAQEFMIRNPNYTRDIEDRWPYKYTERRERWKNHLKAAGLPPT